MSEGWIAFLLVLWLVPGFFSMFVGMQYQLFGRVWLFNLLWLPFWPIMIILIWPRRSR